jgi:hypothetical protein
METLLLIAIAQDHKDIKINVIITNFTGKVAREKRAQIEKSIAASIILPLSFGCLALFFFTVAKKILKCQAPSQNVFIAVSVGEVLPEV